MDLVKVKAAIGAVGAGVVLLAMPVMAAASVGPINFESYNLGNINGQQGWSESGPYDVAVDSVSNFTAASGYNFGTKALRLSDAVTSGGFGDQTFSPSVDPAGEAPGQNSHFDASFSIGSTQAAEQAGMHMSVSPDNGQGARMSYLRFEDHSDGIHVFFDDVTDPGGVGTVANFSDTDIATLPFGAAHTARFSIDFKPGPANDVVKIYLDGNLVKTGTTWEDYYRYDPEQASLGNQLSPTNSLLFRESGTANTLDAGKGYLVDNVSLASSTPVVTPTSKDQCMKNGWTSFTNPTFKNQGDCVSSVASQGKAKGNPLTGLLNLLSLIF